MARTQTLAQMRLRARQKADMETSAFVGDPDATGDPEVTGYVCESVAALWDMLVTAYGENYYSKPTPYAFQSDGVSSSFSLPSDFYKLAKLQVQLNTSLWYTVDRYMDGEDDAYQVCQALSFRMFYVICAPQYATDGSDDNTAFDGINGYEEWAILDAAIKMKNKSQQDASELVQERMMLEQRIHKASRHRDMRQVIKTVDIHSRSKRRFFWNGLSRRVFYQLKMGSIEILQEPDYGDFAWL